MFWYGNVYDSWVASSFGKMSRSPLSQIDGFSVSGPFSSVWLKENESIFVQKCLQLKAGFGLNVRGNLYAVSTLLSYQFKRIGLHPFKHTLPVGSNLKSTNMNLHELRTRFFAYRFHVGQSASVCTHLCAPIRTPQSWSLIKSPKWWKMRLPLGYLVLKYPTYWYSGPP